MSVETQRWFALLIGFICGLLVLAAVEALRTKGINWPAWIQAVGSIIAIFVAIGVAASQSYANRESQQAEWDRRSAEINQVRVDTLRAIEKSAELSVKVFKRACNEIIELKPRDRVALSRRISGWISPLEIALEVLKKLPVHDFPGVLIASQALNIRVGFESVLIALEQIRTKPTADLDAQCSYLSRRIEDFDSQLGKIEEFMNSYDGSLGISRAADSEIQDETQSV
ncbi:hypothetical protein ACVTTK_02465 [Alcaligenes nematophilus]